MTTSIGTPKYAPLSAPSELCIISGYFPGRRFASIVNHEGYAMHHGYRYIDASFRGWKRNRYFRKLEMILRYLPRFEWIFWLDDDAYFTNFRLPLTSFLENVQTENFVVCKSPSTKSVFTKFSSGQFFIRNTKLSLLFLQKALRTNLDDVRKTFWASEHGMFTEGDQDALVYLTERYPMFSDGFMLLLDHNAFNNRPFEYLVSPDEHFLVHFTGKQKTRDKDEMCARLKLNRYLTPPHLLPCPDQLARVSGA